MERLVVETATRRSNSSYFTKQIPTGQQRRGNRRNYFQKKEILLRFNRNRSAGAEREKR